MVTTDWQRFKEYKENGLVKDVFADEAVMKKMKGEEGEGRGGGEAGEGRGGACTDEVWPRACFCAISGTTVPILKLPGSVPPPLLRLLRHWSCALPHRRLLISPGGTALLRQLPARHLPHPQRQPHQHRRPEGAAQQQQIILQQV